VPESDVGKKRSLIYLVLPGMGMLCLIWGYFFGPAWLREAIAPTFNREYGFLENLQVLFLGGIVLVLLLGCLKASGGWERAAFAAAALAGCFVLLEELDYGLHYFRLLSGRPLRDAGGVEYFNLHNIGENTSRFKNIGDLSMFLGFVVFPLVAARSRRPLVRRLCPDPMIIGSMVLMVCLSKGAHWLNAHFPPLPNPLEYRISEFREVFVYYVFLVYFYGLVFSSGRPFRSVRKRLT